MVSRNSNNDVQHNDVQHSVFSDLSNTATEANNFAGSFTPTAVPPSEEIVSPQSTDDQGRASTSLLFYDVPQRSLEQLLTEQLLIGQLFGGILQRSFEQHESSGNRGKSLIEACKNGDKNEVDALLSQLSPEEINYQNKDGNTALATVCCMEDTSSALKFLNIAGVDVNLSNNQGLTPLHHVCSNNNEYTMYVQTITRNWLPHFFHWAQISTNEAKKALLCISQRPADAKPLQVF